MKTNSPIQSVAAPARVVMTTLLVLFAVVVAQMSLMDISRVLWARYPARPPSTKERELTAEQKRIQRIQNARKEFLPDGTVHLVTPIGGPRYTLYREMDSPTAQVQVYDSNDRLLWDGLAGESPYDYLAWAQDLRGDSLMDVRLNMMKAPLPDSARALEFPIATANELLEIWRYLPGRDCFIGYSLQGKRLGYLSAAGMTEAKSQAQPLGTFASFLGWWPLEAYGPTVLWHTERRLYQIDFEQRQVEVIFESPDSDITDLRISRWDAYRPEHSAATAEDRQLLHCRTRDGAYHVISRDPNQSVTVRVPDEWKQWMGIYCQFAATEQDLFLRRDWTEYPARPAYAGSEWRTEFLRTTKTQWVELYRISETGALDLVNEYRWTAPGEDRGVAYAEYRDPPYVQPYVTAFSGLAYDLTWAALRDRAGTSEWWGEGGQLLYEIRPRYRVGSWLVMAVMLTLTFLHARARCTSKATFVFWLLFVAILNLVGFLVYWALNHTPVVKCSACGKRRGLSQAACVRCGAPLPVPEHGRLDLAFAV